MGRESLRCDGRSPLLVVESPAGCSQAVLKSERLHNVLVAEHQCPVAELQEVFWECFPKQFAPGEALEPPPPTVNPIESYRIL